MRAKTFLIIAGAVATASASDVQPQKRQDSTPVVPSVPTACLSALQNLQHLMTEAPQPNSRIISLFMSDTSFASALSANPCEPPQVTGAVGQDLSSYISAASSYYSANSRDLDALHSACGNAGAPGGGVPQCTPGAESGHNNSNGGDNNDGDDNNNGDNNNNNDSNGGNGNNLLDNAAAPRETGMVVAAAAMAGVVVAGIY